MTSLRDLRWARVLYGIEFFAALVAVLLAWPEIGGQEHFDVVAWYWKFALSFGWSAAAVMATRAAARSERVVTAEFVVWCALVLAMSGAMGWLSYQVHLEEDAEEAETWHADLGNRGLRSLTPNSGRG